MYYSTKYSYLKDAEKVGIKVVPTLYLTGDDIKNILINNLLQQFTEQNKSSGYIVRSAVLGEDGSVKSYAGYFQSSGSVKEEDLEKTVMDVYIENNNRAAKLPESPEVHLTVSPFVEGIFGGVAFHPWFYFYNHALVEYSDTPQKAVAGDSVTSLLLSLDSNFPHNPTETGLPLELLTELTSILDTLRKTFQFSIDIEWVWDGFNLYVLQIRPITISPSALRTVPISCYTDDNKYSLDQYGETFGKLSPLSYTVLSTLFENAKYFSNEIGINGNVNFLHRIPTGNIITDKDALAKYFSNKHWYSPFIRSIKSKQIILTLQTEAKAFVPSKEISITNMQYAFDRLQIAEAVLNLRNKKRSTFANSYEYELRYSLIIEEYPVDTVTNIWKRHFMSTLAPLRVIVKQDPALIFCTIEELLKNNKENCILKYKAELSESTNSVQSNNNVQGVELLYGSHKVSKFLCIKSPEGWRGELPRNVIILTPYIPQNWIAELPFVQGIICINLSTLSHVAITLRENNILTLRVEKTIFDKIVQNHENKDISTENILSY